MCSNELYSEITPTKNKYCAHLIRSQIVTCAPVSCVFAQTGQTGSIHRKTHKKSQSFSGTLPQPPMPPYGRTARKSHSLLARKFCGVVTQHLTHRPEKFPTRGGRRDVQPANKRIDSKNDASCFLMQQQQQQQCNAKAKKRIYNNGDRAPRFYRYAVILEKFTSFA